MIPQIPKAMAPMDRKFRFQPPWIRFFALLACIVGVSDALYTERAVTAFRVPDDKIKVDGSPDTLWKAISAWEGENIISFQDYSKIVILGNRNADPSALIPPPAGESIFMMAAFDSKALYFYFQAKVATVANPRAFCPQAALQWKIDAAEVFVDPSPWSQDTAVYRSYFSADASGLTYGTSPKTIQIDKPLYNYEGQTTYFRNRVTGDRFQIPATLPSGVQAVSLRNRNDTNRVSVEMRIPFWGGSAAAFAPGKSIFISWGFNMYPDSLWTKNCATTDPLAFRWAKNHLNYNDASTKPPGWSPNDSTHYDPLRSWDGWGRFILGGDFVDTRTCVFTDTSSWLISDWKESRCKEATTKVVDARDPMRSSRKGFNPASAHGRDVRGRVVPREPRNASPRYNLPREALRAAQSPDRL